MRKILVTPDQAKRWLANNKRNRSISQMLVTKYASIMKSGGWVLTPSGILLGVGEELLDGQHRLAALVEADVSVLMSVFYDVDPGVVDVIDVGRKRTMTHVAERYDCPHASLFSSALHDVGEIMFGGATKRQLPNDHVGKVILHWNTELQPHITAVRSYCKISGIKIKSIYPALHYFCTKLYGVDTTTLVFERLLAGRNSGADVKEEAIKRKLIAKGYVVGNKKDPNVGETMFMLKGIIPLFDKKATVETETALFLATIPDWVVSTMKEGFNLSANAYNAINRKKTAAKNTKSKTTL